MNKTNEKSKKPRWRRWLKRILIAFGIFIAIAYVAGIYSQNVGFYLHSDGPSMEPTMPESSTNWVDTSIYKHETPKVGDVILFRVPKDEHAGDSGGKKFIKRVIAVGGQTVGTVEKDGKGYFTVDGKVLDDEPYVTHHEFISWHHDDRSLDITYPYEVPDGYLFVMGDNRTDSIDSRYFGAIPIDSVIGKVDVQ